MVRFGNTNFDLDYCKCFTANQLRNIYNGEMSQDVELLIAELYPVEESDRDRAMVQTNQIKKKTK